MASKQFRPRRAAILIATAFIVACSSFCGASAQGVVPGTEEIQNLSQAEGQSQSPEQGQGQDQGQGRGQNLPPIPNPLPKLPDSLPFEWLREFVIDIPIQFKDGKYEVTDPQAKEILQVIESIKADGSGTLHRGKYSIPIKKKLGKVEVIESIDIMVKQPLPFSYKGSTPIDGKNLIETGKVYLEGAPARFDSLLVIPKPKYIPGEVLPKYAVDRIKLEDGKLHIYFSLEGTFLNLLYLGLDLPAEDYHRPLDLLQVKLADCPMLKNIKANLFGAQLDIVGGAIKGRDITVTRDIDIVGNVLVNSQLNSASIADVSSYKLDTSNANVGFEFNFSKSGQKVTIVNRSPGKVFDCKQLALSSTNSGIAADLGDFEVDMRSLHLSSNDAIKPNDLVEALLKCKHAKLSRNSAQQKVSFETAEFGNLSLQFSRINSGSVAVLSKADSAKNATFVLDMANGRTKVNCPNLELGPIKLSFNNQVKDLMDAVLSSTFSPGTTVENIEGSRTTRGTFSAPATLNLSLQTQGGQDLVSANCPDLKITALTVVEPGRVMASPNCEFHGISLSGDQSYVLTVNSASALIGPFLNKGLRVNPTGMVAELSGPVKLILSGAFSPFTAKGTLRFSGVEVLNGPDRFYIDQPSGPLSLDMTFAGAASSMSISGIGMNADIRKVLSNGAKLTWNNVPVKVGGITFEQVFKKPAIGINDLSFVISLASINHAYQTAVPDKIFAPPAGSRAPFFGEHEIIIDPGTYIKGLKNIKIFVTGPSTLAIQMLKVNGDIDRRLTGKLFCHTNGEINVGFEVDYRIDAQFNPAFSVKSENAFWHNGVFFRANPSVLGVQDVDDHIKDCNWVFCGDDAWGNGIHGGIQKKLDELSPLKPKNVLDISRFQFDRIGDSDDIKFVLSTKFAI